MHRNEMLAQCLDCLRPGAQTLPPENYEIIVADAGAVSTSESLVRSRVPTAHWVEARGCGPAANRNRGAREARGDWLVFIDDDCLAQKGWLAAIVNTVARGDCDVVEGRTLVPDERDHPLYHAPGNPTGGCYWSCNLAIRRSLFEELRGFDEDFLMAQCEDMEFANRFLRAGAKTIFSPEAVVDHPQRYLGWRGLARSTARLRWHLLFRLKSGAAASLKTPLAVAVGDTAWVETVNRLRLISHIIRRREPALWRSRCFAVAWNWLTYPVMLPYLLVWDVRFRMMLRSRTK